MMPGDELPPAAGRVADELLRRYGLGSALRIELAPGGMLNQNLIAFTPRGGFFLKGYRYTDLLAIKREHQLIAYVAGCGIPAVVPLADPGGATFLRVGGRWWAVFRLVTDQQLPAEALTAAHAREMGHMLGRIHAVLARFPASEATRFPSQPLWASARAADEMAEYEQLIKRLPALDPFDQHALASFAYRRTLLAGGVAPPEAFAGLPTQMLHGDFHEGNLFFDADGSISGVIDWELAAVKPRALEIMRALDVALRLREDLDAGSARLRTFVHAYASQGSLHEEECVRMPELYWAFRVHSLWVYEEHYRKGSARTDRLAMEDLAALEWWLRHRKDLGLALVDALRSAPPRQVLSGEQDGQGYSSLRR